MLHKRPFETAATLIALCEGQSKGKMTRAVTPDTHNAQMAAVRWRRREGRRSGGELKDTFWGHGRMGNSLTHAVRHRGARKQLGGVPLRLIPCGVFVVVAKNGLNSKVVEFQVIFCRNEELR